ncbi:hypothetical protein NPIL_279241 [Nephila pilipes]|uniref:Uncharacterized protein n=1 Tax=Nephila pilipes TaxID=299642 RepID=A0A8X6TGP6_NEPPI|nr:hypothetical protein NPIL_279241 [Nephila pilipes]
MTEFMGGVGLHGLRWSYLASHGRTVISHSPDQPHRLASKSIFCLETLELLMKNRAFGRKMVNGERERSRASVARKGSFWKDP